MTDTEDTTPRESDARLYLKRHKILELFDNMTSMLIYNRPEEMKPFLIKQLEKLKAAKAGGVHLPCLFDDSNLMAIFGMLDHTKQGFITRDQYVDALTTLGVEKFERHPPGSEINKITSDVFMREAKKGLAKASATFKE